MYTSNMNFGYLQPTFIHHRMGIYQFKYYYGKEVLIKSACYIPN